MARTTMKLFLAVSAAVAGGCVSPGTHLPTLGKLDEARQSMARTAAELEKLKKRVRRSCKRAGRPTPS